MLLWKTLAGNWMSARLRLLFAAGTMARSKPVEQRGADVSFLTRLQQVNCYWLRVMLKHTSSVRTIETVLKYFLSILESMKP
jgi:hypothetical protein